jgi:hypothetical protein
MAIGERARPLARTAVLAGAMTMVFGGLPTAAHADVMPSACQDGYQVGATKTISLNGVTALSIKQYWSPSCQKNWGYVYVWQQFIDSLGSNQSWSFSVALEKQGGKRLGTVSASAPARERFSTPQSTGGICTAAWGKLSVTGVKGTVLASNSGLTDFRCG